MADEQHVIESLAGYALGSLDAAEAGAVRAHLAGCAMCRAELAAMEDVAHGLALSVPEVHPPAGLRRRLASRIGEGAGKRRSPQHAPWFTWPAAALAAITLMFASTSAYLWGQLRTRDMLTGPNGMRAVAMQPAEAAPGASGFVLIGADGRNGALVVDRLPDLAEGQTYQVWLTNDAGTVSGAVFTVDEYGYRGARIQAPQNLLSYKWVEITVEPDTGSAQPTGDVVLRGLLQQP